MEVRQTANGSFVTMAVVPDTYQQYLWGCGKIRKQRLRKEAGRRRTALRDASAIDSPKPQALYLSVLALGRSIFRLNLRSISEPEHLKPN